MVQIEKYSFSRLSQGQQPDPVFDDQEDELLNDDVDGKTFMKI